MHETRILVPGLGYPLIVYTDLDASWLLAEWHEVKLQSSLPNKLHASHGDRVAVSQIGSASNGAG
jgi:hypothetical protein